jgi:hypothetical protein
MNEEIPGIPQIFSRLIVQMAVSNNSSGTKPAMQIVQRSNLKQPREGLIHRNFPSQVAHYRTRIVIRNHCVIITLPPGPRYFILNITRSV